jgi:hypothetical protein
MKRILDGDEKDEFTYLENTLKKYIESKYRSNGNYDGNNASD